MSWKIKKWETSFHFKQQVLESFEPESDQLSEEFPVSVEQRQRDTVLDDKVQGQISVVGQGETLANITDSLPVYGDMMEISELVTPNMQIIATEEMEELTKKSTYGQRAVERENITTKPIELEYSDNNLSIENLVKHSTFSKNELFTNISDSSHVSLSAENLVKYSTFSTDEIFTNITDSSHVNLSAESLVKHSTFSTDEIFTNITDSSHVNLSTENLVIHPTFPIDGSFTM